MVLHLGIYSFTNIKYLQTFIVRLYYENLIPVSPTDDHMELREGSNEDEDFEDCVDEVQPLVERPEEDQAAPGGEAEDPTVILEENEAKKELGEENRQ